ncbi:MAG: MucBP domain-containing protein [Lactococcus lactis]
MNKQPFKEQVAYTSPEKKEGSTNKVDGEVSSPEVNIPDYYLKYSILQALNLPVVGSVKDTPVTQDDLLNLTSLDLSNNSILTSLEGIQYASNLTSLTIISPFSSKIDTNLLSSLYKLTSLTIVGSGTGKISDIEFLKNLTSLKFLNLRQNSITDIAPLNYLTNLEQLSLDNCKISKVSVSSLGSLRNLTSLKMSYTGVTDYSWITSLNKLEQLSIANNNLNDADVFPIRSLTNLTNVYIQNNNLTDLSSFKNMHHVELLQAERNQISDLTPLSEFNSIQQINLSNNNVTDITPLTKVTAANANYIMLRGNHISDISSLGNLSSFQDILVDATNQTVTLPEIKSYKGDEVRIDNPFKSIDGKVPALNNISPSSGVYDESNKQIVISDNTSANITGEFVYKEWDGHFGFTATVRQPVNLKIHGGSVIVKYEDGDGNKLSEDDVLSGDDGDPYKSSAKSISGWTVKTTPTNAQGTFTQSPQTVTYVYEKAVAMPVSVRYVDDDGNEIAPSDTLTGKYGDSYKASAKSISGWTVKTTPTNAQGTFTQSPQTVTYVYEKAVAMPVSVRYVDDDGNEIAPSDTLTGKYGDSYKASAKSISGWTVKTTPTNAQGTFTQSPQTVTYVYDRKSETKIMQDKGSGSNNIHQTSNTNSYRKSLLPQTGESSSANLLMVGSILNFVTLIFLFIARKIKKY